MCKHTVRRNDLIRMIAIVAMTFDHVGAFLLPQYQILRLIGRITMPVFAFGVAKGVLYTSNEKKYLIRLGLFAIISQIPFSLVGASGLSTIATIFFTACFLIGIKHKRYYYILSLLALSATIFISMDYGLYFLVLALVTYFVSEKKLMQFILCCLVTIYFSFFYYHIPIQVFSIMGSFLAIYFSDYKKIQYRISKYFFYIYYPAHLLLIFVIKLINT